MQGRKTTGVAFMLMAVALILSCGPSGRAAGTGPAKRTIVVTYPVLGSLVRDLVGDQCLVIVAMPNGLDPHEWEPSARDMANINKADLVVQNGVGLEAGMEKALALAAAGGVPVFTASEHCQVRSVKPGQGIPGQDVDQAAGAPDPHLWLDPSAMKGVELALADELKTRFGLDLGKRATELGKRLDALDVEIMARVARLAPEKRLLVTGHESLGYFAEHYGFTLIGAIVPSLSSQSEVSAADLASLKTIMAGRKVPVVFTELGTAPRVAQALARELGIKSVPIGTHVMPDDGSYFSLMRNLSGSIIDALQ